ncbi:hypothetical protein CRG98_012542 [Punica granatum]|uniref:Uncharacterized protein n=1 Tax=Punica granatum TaxID=22663 RepID=A0A2I0KES4_PUNGR|nr:hypothetical protein CRG98_012542 [Punica granatum]
MKSPVVRVSYSSSLLVAGKVSTMAYFKGSPSGGMRTHPAPEALVVEDPLVMRIPGSSSSPVRPSLISNSVDHVASLMKSIRACALIAVLGP